VAVEVEVGRWKWCVRVWEEERRVRSWWGEGGGEGEVEHAEGVVWVGKVVVVVVCVCV
jgi:hypothetical protein